MAITVNSGSEVKEVNYNDDAVFQLKLNNELVWSKPLWLTVYSSYGYDILDYRREYTSATDPKYQYNSSGTVDAQGGTVYFGDNLTLYYDVHDGNVGTSLPAKFLWSAEVLVGDDYSWTAKIYSPLGYHNRTASTQHQSCTVALVRKLGNPLHNYNKVLTKFKTAPFNHLYEYSGTSDRYWCNLTCDFDLRDCNIILYSSSSYGDFIYRINKYGIPWYNTDYAPAQDCDSWYADEGSMEYFAFVITVLANGKTKLFYRNLSGVDTHVHVYYNQSTLN